MDKRNEGACFACAPYRVTCEHVCPACGQDVPMDDCDSGFSGSTHGMKCSNGCFYWFHFGCGNTTDSLCKPCLLQVPA